MESIEQMRTNSFRFVTPPWQLSALVFYFPLTPPLTLTCACRIQEITSTVSLLSEFVFVYAANALPSANERGSLCRQLSRKSLISRFQHLFFDSLDYFTLRALVLQFNLHFVIASHLNQLTQFKLFFGRILHSSLLLTSLLPGLIDCDVAWMSTIQQRTKDSILIFSTRPHPPPQVFMHNKPPTTTASAPTTHNGSQIWIPSDSRPPGNSATLIQRFSAHVVLVVFQFWRGHARTHARKMSVDYFGKWDVVAYRLVRH